MAKGIYNSFPIIYQTQDTEEDTNEDEREDEGEDAVSESNQGDYGWGLIPLLIQVSKETSTPVHNIYGWAITEFLFYASYIVDTEQKKIKELKKIKK